MEIVTPLQRFTSKEKLMWRLVRQLRYEGPTGMPRLAAYPRFPRSKTSAGGFFHAVLPEGYAFL
jgi:hypothetical protein